MRESEKENRLQADPEGGNERIKRPSTSRSKASEPSCRMLIDDISLGILFHPVDGSDTTL
jgi:hypothetical protein